MRVRLRTHTARCCQPVVPLPQGRACPPKNPLISPCRRLRSTLGSGSCSSSWVFLPGGPQPLVTVDVALALLSSWLLSRAGSRAGVCSRCDEVEDVAVGVGQGYPAAAVLVEAGDLPGAGGDRPVHLVIEGGDGQVEVDAVFARVGFGDLAEDHAGCGAAAFERGELLRGTGAGRLTEHGGPELGELGRVAAVEGDRGRSDVHRLL